MKLETRTLKLETRTLKLETRTLATHVSERQAPLACTVLYRSQRDVAGARFPLLYSGGGTLTLKSGTGMCHGYDPLFSGQWEIPSLLIYHQCATHVPPHF